MAKLKIGWQQFEKLGDEDYAGRRKYVHLESLGRFNQAKLLKFIQLKENSLTSLGLYEMLMTASLLHLILSVVANKLKELILMAVDVRVFQPELDKIVMSQLVHVDISNNDVTTIWLMSIILTTSINFLSAIWCDFTGNNATRGCDVFLQFLRAQEQLESLTLAGISTRFLLKDSETAKSFPFKAKKIDLNLYMNLESEYNFMDFIESQKRSLEELELKFCDLNDREIRRLMTLEIKNLSFWCCKFLWRRRLNTTNPAIECLKVWKPCVRFPENMLGICDLIKLACNATKLKMSAFPITFWVTLAISQEMQQLKAIEMDSCDVESPFVYSSVEEFRFRSIIPSQVMKLIYANRQLKKVIFEEDRLDRSLTRAMAKFPSIEVVVIRDE